ncbi:unnamed protein product, partial [Didymodactylos carnosus]
ETLKARLAELRARRHELEKVREEVIRRLKNIHNRITLRRKEARDMWKKKYFTEKKKMPPLEERVQQLQNDLDQIQKKTLVVMNQESKHAPQTDVKIIVVLLTSQDNRVQFTKMQYSIQDIRYQLDQAKLRLTTDIK